MTRQYADFISKQLQNDTLRSSDDLEDLVEYSTTTKKHLFGAHSAHVETDGEGDDYASHLDKAEKSHGKDSKSGVHKEFDSLHKNSQKGLKDALTSHAAGGKHMEYDDHHIKTLDHMDKALKHDGGKKEEEDDSEDPNEIWKAMKAEKERESRT